MTYKSLDYQVQDGIATVTFARPATLNSLTFEVYGELERLARECQTDERVKVLVITGSGKGFCSGGDVHEIIGELVTRNAKGMLEFTRMTGAVTRNLRMLDTIDAFTAERYGLVNRLVPHADLPDETRRLARRLAEGPSHALGMTKRMLEHEWNMDLLGAIEAEAQAQALLLMGEDHTEFYRAFTENRSPKFTGR
jgi:enoyl-CoA hydratase/carnithine racemase